VSLIIPAYASISGVDLFSNAHPSMKVGKNNFRPPPQVESSVVRIEIKTADKPQISFEEWDGMLRVCFSRKNKTLRASWLGTKEVVSMVERNYRVWCSMNNVPVDDTLCEDTEDMEVDASAGGQAEDDEWGGIMDVDGEDEAPEFFKELKEAAANEPAKTKSKRKKTKVAMLVREKIRKVLEDDTELADQRPAKCSENDFLRLLYAFNAEGIHFS
jgi:18S rRNA (adenine1779-N6/adenine1780-N6)-dimethyltransferase